MPPKARHMIEKLSKIFARKNASSPKLDSITMRRSIRRYTDTPVPEALIEEILEAARCAPSAKNRQPWFYTVYQGEAKARFLKAFEAGINREKSGEAILPDSARVLPDAFYSLKILSSCPVLIVVQNTNAGDPYLPVSSDKRIAELCDSLAIGASVQNMLLKAIELGLGTLWIANSFFAYPELEAQLGDTAQILSIIALGYPAQDPPARPRKTLDEIRHYRS